MQAFITPDGVVQAGGGPDEDREGDFGYGGWTAAYDELDQGTGEETRVWGSTKPIKTLAEHDLIDEDRLIVYPLALGTGKKLSSDGFAPTRVALVETRALPNGVLVNTYRRADAG